MVWWSCRSSNAVDARVGRAVEKGETQGFMKVVVEC
jgi:hypothetical protein